MHTMLTLPLFEDRRPSPDATIWRISLSASRALKLICDIGHLYPSSEWRPRVGAMLENDGAWTLYLWPRATPDSALLLTLLDYGAARLCDASRWNGQCWLTGDRLYRSLAVLAERAYFNLTAEPKLLADERSGYLLRQPRQVTR